MKQEALEIIDDESRWPIVTQTECNRRFKAGKGVWDVLKSTF